MKFAKASLLTIILIGYVIQAAQITPEQAKQFKAHQEAIASKKADVKASFQQVSSLQRKPPIIDGKAIYKQVLAKYVNATVAVKQEKEALRCNLGKAGLHEACNMKCVEKCSFGQNNLPWASCFKNCGCFKGVKLPGGNHGKVTTYTTVFEWGTPDNLTSTKPLLGGGGHGRAPIPSGPAVKCQITREDQYELIIAERRKKIRTAAVSAAELYQHIHFPNLKIGFTYVVIKEIQLQDETLISFNISGGHIVTFRVRRTQGYENGFIIDWDYKGHSYKYYVIVQDRRAGSYSVIILDQATLVVEEVLSARFSEQESYFGYHIIVKHEKQSKEIEEVIIEFGKKIGKRKFEKPIQVAAALATFAWFQPKQTNIQKFDVFPGDFSDKHLIASVHYPGMKQVYQQSEVSYQFGKFYIGGIKRDGREENVDVLIREQPRVGGKDLAYVAYIAIDGYSKVIYFISLKPINGGYAASYHPAPAGYKDQDISASWDAYFKWRANERYRKEVTAAHLPAILKLLKESIKTVQMKWINGKITLVRVKDNYRWDAAIEQVTFKDKVVRPGRMYTHKANGFVQFTYVKMTFDGFQAFWFNSKGQFQGAAESVIVKVGVDTYEYRSFKILELDASTQTEVNAYSDLFIPEKHVDVTYLLITINKIKYYIRDDQTVWQDNTKFICKYGKQCLDDYIAGLYADKEVDVITTLYTIFEVTVDKKVVETIWLYKDASGKFTSEKGVQLGTGGYEALIKYLIKKYKTTYKISIPDPKYVKIYVKQYREYFYVSDDDQVWDAEYRFVCKGYNNKCLSVWLKEREKSKQMTYEIINIDNEDYILYFDGRVEDSKGKSICKSGAQECLWIYILKLRGESIKADIDYEEAQYTTVKITIREQSGSKVVSRETWYWIWRNGTVTTDKSVFVTAGGYQGLLKWLQSKTIKFEEIKNVDRGYSVIRIKPSQDQYYIFRNGTVTYTNFTFICTGGARGLLIWLRGRTTTPSGTNKPEYSIVTTNINTIIYHVYTKSGKVITSDGTLICKQNGIKCLREYLEVWQKKQGGTTIEIKWKEVEPDYSIIRVQPGNIIYFLWKNNTVTDHRRKWICNGGVKCLKEFIEEERRPKYQSITIGNDAFLIWINGTVSDARGKFITTGGYDALIQWWIKKQASLTTTSTTTTTTITITSVSPDYFLVRTNVDKIIYHLYFSNRVTTSNGEFICDGGIACLKAYLSKKYKSTITFTESQPDYQIIYLLPSGRKFFLYRDERVTTDSHVVFCEKGGLKCLQDKILEEMKPTYTLVTIFDVRYKVHHNSSVTLENGQVIATGGMDGLIRWTIAQKKTDPDSITFIGYQPDYQAFRTTLNKVTYFVYKNGRITESNGNFICEGGLNGLRQYLSAKYKIKAGTQVILAQNSEKFTVYYMLPDGKKFILIERTGQVLDDNYNFICSGGYTCIQGWVMQQTQVKYQIVNYGKWRFHYFKESGHSQWANGTEVSQDGLAGLKRYIQSLLRPPYSIAEINGIQYKLYPNGTAYGPDGKWVSEGGEEGLKKWVEDRLRPKYDIVSINGVEYKVFNTNGTSYDASWKLVSSGGVKGLQDYLTEYYRVKYRILQINDLTLWVWDHGVVTDTNYKYLTVGGVEGAQQCVISKSCVRKPGWIIKIGPTARSQVVIDANLKKTWKNAYEAIQIDMIADDQTTVQTSTTTTTKTTKTKSALALSQDELSNVQIALVDEQPENLVMSQGLGSSDEELSLMIRPKGPPPKPNTHLVKKQKYKRLAQEINEEDDNKRNLFQQNLALSQLGEESSDEIQSLVYWWQKPQKPKQVDPKDIPRQYPVGLAQEIKEDESLSLSQQMDKENESNLDLNSEEETQIQIPEITIEAEQNQETFLGPDHDYQAYDSSETWFPEQENANISENSSYMGIPLMALLALICVILLTGGLYKKYDINAKNVNNEDTETTRNLAEALIARETKAL